MCLSSVKLLDINFPPGKLYFDCQSEKPNNFVLKKIDEEDARMVREGTTGSRCQ